MVEVQVEAQAQSLRLRGISLVQSCLFDKNLPAAALWVVAALIVATSGLRGAWCASVERTESNQEDNFRISTR